MEGNRRRNSIKEYRKHYGNEGIALVSAFIVSIIAIVAIAIMYYVVTKTTSSNVVIATYSSVRDATDGCIKYGVSLLMQCTFDDQLQMPGDCVGPYNIRYKIRNVGTYTSTLSICLSSYKAYSHAGSTELSAMERAGCPFNMRGNTYTVICETRGDLKPGQPGTPTIYSRAETIYIPP